MIIPANRPKTERGRQRRERILGAAEAVFGEQGFAAASIAEITRRAGTAQGTLYIYFDGKEQIFRELLLGMGGLTRAEMSGAAATAPDRLAAERAALTAFLRVVAHRPGLYRIVEAARFADTDADRSSFASLGRACESQLRAAEAAGEVRPGDARIRAWALIGIAKALSERSVLWSDGPGDRRGRGRGLRRRPQRHRPMTGPIVSGRPGAARRCRWGKSRR